MSKDKRSEQSGYEVIEPKRIKQIINLLVDFTEKNEIQAKEAMVAMEIIVGKIKSHLGIETIINAEESDTVH